MTTPVPPPEADVGPGRFRTVLGRFCTGVAIITTAAQDDTPVGFACQSFAALSLDPPLVLFCPMRTSRSWLAIEQSGHFGVNLLSQSQQGVCATFGSRNPDKFGDIDWSPSALGSPMIDGSLAYLDCTVENVYDGGDHLVVHGRVHSLHEFAPDLPLLFYRGQYRRIGAAEGQAQRADLESFLITAADMWL